MLSLSRFVHYIFISSSLPNFHFRPATYIFLPVSHKNFCNKNLLFYMLTQWGSRYHEPMLIRSTDQTRTLSWFNLLFAHRRNNKNYIHSSVKQLHKRQFFNVNTCVCIYMVRTSQYVYTHMIARWRIKRFNKNNLLVGKLLLISGIPHR